MQKSETIISLIICGIILLIALGFIALIIYVWIAYGNKPVTEIPAWALAIMFGRGGK